MTSTGLAGSLSSLLILDPLSLPLAPTMCGCPSVILRRPWLRCGEVGPPLTLAAQASRPTLAV
jgi:hypothetical protein